MKKNFPVMPLLAVSVFCIALLYLYMREHGRQDELPGVSPAFRAYVQAFTSGLVSTRSAVIVRLNEELSDSALYSKETGEKLFSFSPGIKGKTSWLDSRTVAFQPDEPLPQDEAFNVTFDLSRLLQVPDSLRKLRFGFITMRQVVEVSVENHAALHAKDLTREYLTGTLRTSDQADAVSVPQLLTASQDGRELPVSWTHDGKRNEHFFRVDSIRRSSTAGSVKISWDGNPLESESSGDTLVPIPALGDFRVVRVQNASGEQPCISVQFSDLLSTAQNLDGLYRVGQMTDMRYSIEENILRIYFPESQEKKFKLTLEKEIRNVNDKMLDNPFKADVTVDDIRPNLRFAGDGVILPPSQGMLLPFEAVNLNAVDIRVVRIFEKNILQFLQVNELSENNELIRVGRIVLQKTMPLQGVADRGKWNRFSIDLSALMKTEPGAIYSVILSFRQSYSAWPCNGAESTAAGEQKMVQFSDPEGLNERDWGWYGNYYDDEYGNGGWRNYNWIERDDPCKPSYYFNKTISRNVLASNLGLIAKSGSDGKWLAVVTDLVAARPVSGADLTFYNYQMQPVGNATTDGEGMASVDLKVKPFIMVARFGDQTGYLKLNEGKTLSLSMFDISGEPVQKGMKGFIYGERGVWRPGDSIYLTFILEDKTKLLPPGHPVIFTMTNPSGQPSARIVRTASLNGFYRFATSTPWDAPTGNWTARVVVGNAEFTKTLKIETVKPNRLKILFDFGTDKLVSGNLPSAALSAAWLTGATARNLKARVALTLNRSVTAFKNCPGYVFDNPTVGFAPENLVIFDGKLDEQGKTTITPDIHVTNIAPGALKASFETTVFEESGDFSIDRFSLPYYPYGSYAGLKVPQEGGGDRVLSTGKTCPVELINVDPEGKPVASGRLRVELFRMEWRWWWDDTERGGADFISLSYMKPVDTATIRTSGGKGTYPLFVQDDGWGRYLIRVTDLASGHAAGKVVYIDWPGYYRMPGGEKQAAAMLTLTTDKSVYQVGQQVKLTLPSSPDGRALVTIENGTSVIRSFWVPTKAGSTVIPFAATADMAPNCYAYVTLIQPHSQTMNDLPIRLYGVVPVAVENPNTHLKPAITMPNLLEPGKETSITVKEQTGKPMTYTLAVVDEGLLDLTRFKTPDPWDRFYTREALGVKTWDLYDQVMGAFTGELQRILSIGGDKEELSNSSLKANRFKPMVKYFGPFELRKGQQKTHTFTMPEYIGSVRVMVVAGQDGAYGCAEKAVPVRKSLMVLGTLPRVLGPGETVSLPVTVFAMEPAIKNATVEVITDDLVSLSGAGSKQVSFSGVGDKVVTFELKVAQRTGIARIKIVAASGKERAVNEIEIGVRNANMPATLVSEKAIDPGSEWNTPIRAPGMAGTNRGFVELSIIPAMNLNQRLHELITYPYGCIEQTVSAAFPQLYLKELTEISPARKRDTEHNINTAIRRLKSFQLPGGGFGYWPGAQYPDEWGTIYAGHFLLEAELKGYSTPPGWLQPWREYMREKAASWSVNASYQNDDLVQAYRLYTLALAGFYQLGPMNRLFEYKNLSTAARWRLAAAYVLAGKKEVAAQLVGGAPVVAKPYQSTDISFGSELRDKSMMLETMTLLGMRTKAMHLMKEIARMLSGPTWLSTQTTAWALLAMSKYSGNQQGAAMKAVIAAGGGEAEEISSGQPVVIRDVEVIPGAGSSLKVRNNGKSVLFARLVTTGIPVGVDTLSTSNRLKIHVVYRAMDNSIISPLRIQQGTNFLAEVTVIHPGQVEGYKRMALTQIFPSGWEIINSRSSDLAASVAGGAAFDYQDIRDDRVSTFFDLNPAQSKTFTVMLMAAWPGRYYLPATGCSAMYDNTINARLPGRWVEVIP